MKTYLKVATTDGAIQQSGMASNEALADLQLDEDTQIYLMPDDSPPNVDNATFKVDTGSGTIVPIDGMAENPFEGKMLVLRSIEVE